MNTLVFDLFGHHTALTNRIVDTLQLSLGKLMLRHFPDGETYLRFYDELKNKDILIVTSLDQPDKKILPLLFTAQTAKELGARRVGLVCPYLAYMRQDQCFNPGEAVTSKYFAGLLSQCVDYLITVDPHLHRYHSLSEIYSIPTQIVSSANKISTWINNNVKKPVLIGPDQESQQWVAKVAGDNIPYVILEKTRHGDKEVEISTPELTKYQDHTPVLVDDIISTAHTMIETIRTLQHKDPPVCIGVHAVFAADAYERLLHEKVTRVISCNTIIHASNQIDLTDDIIAAIKI